MTLLIVDDNPEMRRLLRSIVQKMTDAIFECADGAQALESYQKYLPEWVLMDVDMPQKDGLTATREICSAYPKARVVIVTNYADAVIREAAAKAGACGYVMKENLLELRGILGGNQARN